MGGSTLPPVGATVTSLAISPDGDRFAAGTEGGDRSAMGFEHTPPERATFKLVGTVRCLAFRPDGRALAIGLEDGTIPIWEVPRAGPIAPPLRTPGPIRAVSFGRDGRHLLTVGGRGLRRWGLDRRGEPTRSVPVGRPRDADEIPTDHPGRTGSRRSARTGGG